MNTSDRIIRNVESTMKMDGLPFSDDTKEKIINCLIGKSTFHETAQSIVSMYKQGD